jgi:hypothetical protein
MSSPSRAQTRKPDHPANLARNTYQPVRRDIEWQARQPGCRPYRGYACGRSHKTITLSGYWESPTRFAGVIMPRRQPSPVIERTAQDGLPGREVERFGMGAPVVLGQGLADGARPVRDRVVADLAARDRQAGDRHGETAGKRRLAHLLPSCHLIRGDLARALCHGAAPPDTGDSPRTNNNLPVNRRSVIAGNHGCLRCCQPV